MKTFDTRAWRRILRVEKTPPRKPFDTRAWRRNHKAKGLCWHCNSEPEPGKTVCAKHREYLQQYNLVHKERLRRAQQQNAAERRSRGLCWNCHSKAEPGKTRCTKHLEAMRVGFLRLKQRKYQQARSEFTCHRCSADVAPGRALCAKHLEAARLYQRAYGERKKRGGAQADA